MNATAALADVAVLNSNVYAVASAARSGLTQTRKSLPPWLFYDETGSDLFEQITQLPEYYLTRIERGLFEQYSCEILHAMGLARPETTSRAVPLQNQLTIVELGAGTAAKTRILLRALVDMQREVFYQPIDVSASSLEHAGALEKETAGLTVRPLVADYVAEGYVIERPPRARVLALYIGSSIGNFAPEQASEILSRLRRQLRPGDGLLLGTDLAPGKHKSAEMLCAAYDDAQGITAEFNRNILTRVNRELGADFHPERFAHVAIWNQRDSRMEMHLESQEDQTVAFPPNGSGSAFTIRFKAGERIHTENSYKFTPTSIDRLLTSAGFHRAATFMDERKLFALNLARVR